MAPDDVARCAAAVARLRVPPGDAWLRAALAATAGRLGEVGGAGGLARLATALCRAGAAPGPAWLEELSAAALAAAAAEVGAAGQGVPLGQQQELQQHQQRKQQERQQQQQQQRQQWQEEPALGAAALSLEPVHVGLLALALHRWGWHPGADTSAALLHACAPRLARHPSSRLQLALTLLAAARWAPPRDWLDAARGRAEAAAARGAYSEQQHDKVLWALMVLSGE
jgi:hypothetical protein